MHPIEFPRQAWFLFGDDTHRIPFPVAQRGRRHLASGLLGLIDAEVAPPQEQHAGLSLPWPKPICSPQKTASCKNLTAGPWGLGRGVAVKPCLAAPVPADGLILDLWPPSKSRKQLAAPGGLCPAPWRSIRPAPDRPGFRPFGCG